MMVRPTLHYEVPQSSDLELVQTVMMMMVRPTLHYEVPQSSGAGTDSDDADGKVSK